MIAGPTREDGIDETWNLQDAVDERQEQEHHRHEEGGDLFKRVRRRVAIEKVQEQVAEHEDERVRDLCVANIPTGVRIATQTCTSRPERRRFGLPTTLTTRLHRERLRTADGDPRRRRAIGLTLFVDRRGPMEARTKGTSARTPWGQLQPPMRRWVPAGAFSNACTVVKVILGDTQAKRRASERTRPIDNRPLIGGARPIA